MEEKYTHPISGSNVLGGEREEAINFAFASSFIKFSFIFLHSNLNCLHPREVKVNNFCFELKLGDIPTPKNLPIWNSLR